MSGTGDPVGHSAIRESPRPRGKREGEAPPRPGTQGGTTRARPCANIERGLSRTLLLLCLAALCPPAGSQNRYSSPGQPAQQHPFMESMQIMMDAMGVNRQGGGPGSSSSWPSGSESQPFSGYPGFGSSLPGQSQMRQMMRNAPYPANRNWMSQFPGNWSDMGQWSQSFQQFASPGTQLEGTWQGRGGEVLVVRGNRYRIYAAPDQHTDGQLAIEGDILWLGNPQAGTVQRYEFASHEGRLALRDPWGPLLLFRRSD